VKTRQQKMQGKKGKDRIIFALDTDDIDKAIGWVRKLTGHVGGFKIGFELQQTMLVSLLVAPTWVGATRYLMKVRELYHLLNGQIFWDCKLDDIPKTVAGASKAVARLEALMFNFHCSAGKASIKSAVENKGNLLALGVTVLTTTKNKDCVSIFGSGAILKVLQFVGYLREAGADGVICSAQEALAIRDKPDFDELIIVAPGIRPAVKNAEDGVKQDDQERVLTPSEAIRAGIDFPVIGRPISEAPDPVAAADAIAAEIDETLDRMAA